MLPIVLTELSLSIGLAGAGKGLERRRSLLASAGIVPVPVPPHAPEDVLTGISILFIAGLARPVSQRLAGAARGKGILVNVEDQPDLCDFHVPAIVRRGDLTVSISTAGRAPGLAKLIREWIERRLGLDWGGHLEEIGQARAAWRGKGMRPPEVSQRLRDWVREKELLP